MLKGLIQTFIFGLIGLVFSVNAYAGTCTADSRTNVSANSVLTSSKYNTDLNTVYNRLNGNLDGGCITDGTVESGTLGDSIVTRAKIADGALGAGEVAKTTDYTMTASDDVVLVDSSSGAVTITLPTAVGIDDKIYVIKVTDATNLITIDADGTETIDGNLTYIMGSTGQSVALISDNVNWHALSDKGEEVVVIRDLKAANTAGGTCTSGGWRTRDLNTFTGSTAWASISANQFTVQPGKYYVHAQAPAYRVNSHTTRIYNISDSSVEIVGAPKYTLTTSEGMNTSHIHGVIEYTAAKTFELQHRCQTTFSTQGFGFPANMGQSEVYGQVYIRKID